jgi:hypothetical protein
MLWPFLMLHICGAVIGLLSGFAAMALRKGSSWHGAAGTVFFVSMLAMSASGAVIATFLRPNRLNTTVALLTLYLVGTAWRAARHRETGTSRFDVIALLFVAAVGLSGILAGIEAAGTPRGTKHGMPAAAYFVFGTVALLCAVTDVRMLRRGGLAGTQRLRRHIWRMSLALLIATLSFFPGQAKLFPTSLRSTGVLFIPHVLLIGSMAFWMFRYRTRRVARAGRTAQVSTSPATQLQQGVLTRSAS